MGRGFEIPRMKVRRRGQHPQAQRRRQQNAEASLQAARQDGQGGWLHDGNQCSSATWTSITSVNGAATPAGRIEKSHAKHPQMMGTRTGARSVDETRTGARGRRLRFSPCSSSISRDQESGGPRGCAERRTFDGGMEAVKPTMRSSLGAACAGRNECSLAPA